VRAQNASMTLSLWIKTDLVNPAQLTAEHAERLDLASVILVRLDLPSTVKRKLVQLVRQLTVLSARLILQSVQPARMDTDSALPRVQQSVSRAQIRIAPTAIRMSISVTDVRQELILRPQPAND